MDTRRIPTTIPNIIAGMGSLASLFGYTGGFSTSDRIRAYGAELSDREDITRMEALSIVSKEMGIGAVIFVLLTLSAWATTLILSMRNVIGDIPASGVALLPYIVLFLCKKYEIGRIRKIKDTHYCH